MASFRRFLIAVLLLAALPFLAHAAPRPGAPYYDTQMEALNACQADLAEGVANWGGPVHSSSVQCVRADVPPGGSAPGVVGTYQCTLRDLLPNGSAGIPYSCDWHSQSNATDQFYYYRDGTACPGGYGVDPLTRECMDRDKCLSRNSNIFKGARLSATPIAQCYDIGGCAFGPAGSVEQVNGPGMARYRATLSYSGESPSSCSNIDPAAEDIKPDAPKKEQECMPAGNGQTYCVKADGRQCASASNGKQFCWKPGETGTKTDGPDLQKRDAGDTHIPPNLQLPSGDNLVKQGETIKTSTTTTNVTNNTSTTVTTNVTSYRTGNGTNASGGSDPKEADGSGGGGGEEEGEENGASGGGDCKDPPIVTGDAALGMVATQAWATRCAVEAGNAAKVSGDIGDCKSAFSVEGDNANAIKLRAMRAQICGEPEWAKAKDGEGSTDNPTAGEGEGMGDGLLKFDFDIGNAFDHSGFFGGASPPSLGVLDFGFFGTFDMDSEPWFPDLIALCRGFLILLAIFLAIQIILRV